MTDVTVGHNIQCSLSFLDQNGNPMLTPVVADVPPVWTNTATASETLKVSADGLTCEVDAVSAGADTVSVSLAVAGKPFAASISVNVTAAPQVLTSVVINTVVS